VSLHLDPIGFGSASLVVVPNIAAAVVVDRILIVVVVVVVRQRRASLVDLVHERDEVAVQRHFVAIHI
jgi:hypothetical protein